MLQAISNNILICFGKHTTSSTKSINFATSYTQVPSLVNTPHYNNQGAPSCYNFGYNVTITGFTGRTSGTSMLFSYIALGY